MNANKKTSTYKSFLLRLWQEGSAATWRATLENPHSGERHGFASLESLFAFLQTIVDEETQPENAADDDDQAKK